MTEHLPEQINGSAPEWFPVSRLKLFVMSIVTGGIYELYWFYKNWVLVKRRENSDISPFWRAFFAFFFCYSLFSRIKQSAIACGIATQLAPGWLAAGWIVLTMTWRLPGPAWLICYLAIFLLLPIQKTIIAVNEITAPDSDKNGRFSAGNVVGIVLGGAVFLLALVGTFLPD